METLCGVTGVHSTLEMKRSASAQKPNVGDDGDAEWTRVDRRKAKKARKSEAKLDVRELAYSRLYDLTFLVGGDTTIHVCEQRDRQEKRRYPHRCESLCQSFGLIHHRRRQDVRDLVLHIIADAPPPNWVKIQVRFFSCSFSHASDTPQNARSIQKVVALLIPGILPDFLALPPLPTSATANPNIPVAIPLPGDSKTSLPFIASTFSHACPTRAPGDQTRMYSVLGSFFQGPVSGEEKKKRIEARIACMRLYFLHNTP